MIPFYQSDTLKGPYFLKFWYNTADFGFLRNFKMVSFFGLRFFSHWDYNAHFEKRTLFGDVFKFGIISRFLRNEPFLLKKVPFGIKGIIFEICKRYFFPPKHLKSRRDSYAQDSKILSH